MGRVRHPNVRSVVTLTAALEMLVALAGVGALAPSAAFAQPPPPAPLGHVAIHEKDQRPLRVVVDGVDCGPLPWEGTLEAGPHQVYGLGEAFSAPRRSFTVVAGESTDVELAA